MLQDSSNFYWQAGALREKNFSIKGPQGQEKPESLSEISVQHQTPPRCFAPDVAPCLHTSPLGYLSIPAITVTTVFLPLLLFPDQATEKKERKKNDTPRLTFLSGQKRSTDTCKPLWQSKPHLAGLLISSILLPQEQVSQDSFQLGGPAPACSSSLQEQHISCYSEELIA